MCLILKNVLIDISGRLSRVILKDLFYCIRMRLRREIVIKSPNLAQDFLALDAKLQTGMPPHKMQKNALNVIIKL